MNTERIETPTVSKSLTGFTKRDFRLVTLVGFAVGWLVLLPLTSTELLPVTVGLAAVSVVGLSVFAPLALFVLGLVAQRLPVVGQFAKFAAVGTLNTLLNFAVLNSMILWTGETRGAAYSGFVVLAFLVATTNSYFWNKFWTFESRRPVTGGEYARFALFTIGGAFLNVGAASIVVNVIGAPAGVGGALWANVGGLAGVAASFLWNFTMYRRVVFRRPATGTDHAATIPRCTRNMGRARVRSNRLWHVYVRCLPCGDAFLRPRRESFVPALRIFRRPSRQCFSVRGVLAVE